MNAVLIVHEKEFWGSSADGANSDNIAPESSPGFLLFLSSGQLLYIVLGESGTECIKEIHREANV